MSFANELEAKMALARRINQDKGEVRHYPCPYNKKHYHLTSLVEYKK